MQYRDLESACLEFHEVLFSEQCYTEFNKRMYSLRGIVFGIKDYINDNLTTRQKALSFSSRETVKLIELTKDVTEFIHKHFPEDDAGFRDSMMEFLFATVWSITFSKLELGSNSPAQIRELYQWLSDHDGYLLAEVKGDIYLPILTTDFLKNPSISLLDKIITVSGKDPQVSNDIYRLARDNSSIEDRVTLALRLQDPEWLLELLSGEGSHMSSITTTRALCGLLRLVPNDDIECGICSSLFEQLVPHLHELTSVGEQGNDMDYLDYGLDITPIESGHDFLQCLECVKCTPSTVQENIMTLLRNDIIAFLHQFTHFTAESFIFWAECTLEGCEPLHENRLIILAQICSIVAT